MKIIVIFFISLLRSTSLHLYAAAEQTYLVSQSPSLKNIYACKDKCFALNQTFPFPMKVFPPSYSVCAHCVGTARHQPYVP